MEIHGYCDERFSAVRDVFAENFEIRGDLGACFAATLEGEYVVDIWAGYQDAARSKPWEEDTIVNVYSTTKTMTFISALMLADRGELDLEAPVTEYWPEFGRHGKQGVRVKHFLSHSAGVPGFSRPFSPEELYDWDLCCSDLASQSPWWEPGTQSGYHAVTQGYLIGEVIRRITGSSFGTFFKKEVADKVGADFQIGVDQDDFSRIAEIVPAIQPIPVFDMEPDSIPGRVFRGAEDVVTPAVTSSSGWRQAEIPAANGHGNARSVVRAQTAMANDGRAFGVELLSSKACRDALQLQTDGMDLVIGAEIRYGMGYGLPNSLFSSPNENVLWWGGAGGSTISNDLDSRLCISYVMNQMTNDILGDPRGVKLAAAVYESLGQ